MLPSAIRAGLAAYAGPDVLQHYDDDLGRGVSSRSVSRGDLTPIMQTVRRWWFEADAWRDPGGRQHRQPAKVTVPTSAAKSHDPASPRDGQRDAVRPRRSLAQLTAGVAAAGPVILGMPAVP